MKPSWKSFSTWMAVASAVVGGLLASGVIADGSLVFRILGAAQMILSALGYQAVKATSVASVAKSAALEAAAKSPLPK